MSHRHNEAPLLFDVENDPGEWYNLAGSPEVANVEATLPRRSEEESHPGEIEAGEWRRQQERLFIQEAHSKGDQVSWDCQPHFDASKQYTR